MLKQCVIGCNVIFSDAATTDIYTVKDPLSLHDALPISTSTEVDKFNKYPVIDLMIDEYGNIPLGGTMILGAYGPANHEFEITAIDENGDTVRILNLISQ